MIYWILIGFFRSFHLEKRLFFSVFFIRKKNEITHVCIQKHWRNSDSIEIWQIAKVRVWEKEKRVLYGWLHSFRAVIFFVFLNRLGRVKMFFVDPSDFVLSVTIFDPTFSSIPSFFLSSRKSKHVDKERICAQLKHWWRIFVLNLGYFRISCEIWLRQ